MLTLLKKSDFDKVYQLMKAAFPPDERRPYELQLSLLEREDYSILVNASPNGEPAAFFAIYDLNDFLFIEHFAVGAKFRNRGLGSMLLGELKKSSTCPLCLEVELPKNDLSRRRIEFYRRNGFFYNDYPYTQPPLATGQDPVVLRLMTTDTPLTEGQFKAARDLIYNRVYHDCISPIASPL